MKISFLGKRFRKWRKKPNSMEKTNGHISVTFQWNLPKVNKFKNKFDRVLGSGEKSDIPGCKHRLVKFPNQTYITVIFSIEFAKLTNS